MGYNQLIWCETTWSAYLMWKMILTRPKFKTSYRYIYIYIYIYIYYGHSWLVLVFSHRITVFVSFIKTTLFSKSCNRFLIDWSILGCNFSLKLSWRGWSLKAKRVFLLVRCTQNSNCYHNDMIAFQIVTHIRIQIVSLTKQRPLWHLYYNWVVSFFSFYITEW